MGPNGPVGLSMLAVNQAMIDYDIEWDERILFSTTVRNMANLIFSEQAEEAAAKAKQLANKK